MPSSCLTEGGRDQIGMVAAIRSERWPRSNRNTWPPCVGIRSFVIDARDYDSEAALRKALPQVYQRLKETVYPKRKTNNDPKLREFWWKFRRSNEVYFSATEGLPRFIATVETTKHRSFVFVGSDELLEHGVVGFGFSDSWILGVLSSRQHVCWALANGGTLEDRPRYNKDVCFGTFPSVRHRCAAGCDPFHCGGA